MYLEVDSAIKHGVLCRALATYGAVLLNSVDGKEHLIANHPDYQTLSAMMRDLKYMESKMVEDLARIALEHFRKTTNGNHPSKSSD